MNFLPGPVGPTFDVHERSVTRDAEVGRARAGVATRILHENVIDHWDELASHFEPIEIEAHGSQAPRNGVDQMARRCVSRVTSLRNDDLPLPRRQVQDGHLGVLTGRLADPVDGEQHRSATWQNLRPLVKALTFCSIGRRERFRRAACVRHAEEPGLVDIGREHDRAVHTPTGAAQQPRELADGHRRPACDRHFQQRHTVGIADPAALR